MALTARMVTIDGADPAELPRMPVPRQGKKRVHVDWPAADRTAEVSRPTGPGATVG